MNKILFIIGARPNFMKMLPVYESLKKLGKYDLVILHTGQHYDENMSDCFIKLFELPIIYLKKNNKEKNLLEYMFKNLIIKIKEISPSLVLIFGDVNSSLVGALSSDFLEIPIAHIEAGNRCFDKTVPEEVNRITIDRIAKYHFVSEPNGIHNLINENIITKDMIGKTCFYTGNPMIDTLLKFKSNIELSKEYQNIYNYILVTVHRQSNVDVDDQFNDILKMIQLLSCHYKIIFVVHPRIKNKISCWKITQHKNIILQEPLDYISFIGLMVNSGLVLTDSGGVSEETTALGIPCITLRDSTERPITVTHGTNILCKDVNNFEEILSHVDQNIGKRIKIRKIKYWDGKAGYRISKYIDKIICSL